MLKVMGQIRRRPDLSLDAFRLHWRTIHRGLALRLAEGGIMRGYVQNHRLDLPIDGLLPVADGVPELWFDDVAAFAALRTSPYFRDGAFHDEPAFMDITDYRSLPLGPESLPASTDMPSRQECVGLLKAMFFLGDAAPFAEAGSSLVMPDARPVRLAWHQRAETNLAIKVADDAIVETSWWPSLPAFADAWARRPSSAHPVRGMLVEERPVFWPGEPPPPADWRPVAPTRT